MKYTLSVLLLGSLFVPFIAKADIAPDPGFHEVTSCAFFDNLSDFPDYDVYATSQGRFGPSAILARSSDAIDTALASEYGCGIIGKPFFAINQDDQVRITHAIDDEKGDYLDELDQNQQYFINATVTGASNFDYSDLVRGEMPDSNPTATYVSTYHIDTLNDLTFNVRLVGEALYDEDGKLLSEVTDTSTPMNSVRSATPYVILFALIALGGALLSRAYRNVSQKK